MPDPSFVLPLIIQSALVPFAAALAALILFRAARLPGQAPAIALTIGVVASYFATFHAQWSLAPNQALDWLPYIAVTGAAGAIAVEQVRGPALRAGARFALAIVAAAVAIWPALPSVGPEKAVAVLIVTALFICVAWTLLANAAATEATPPFILAVIAGSAALTLMLDSSQAIGQSSGALAAALAGFIAFNLPRLRAGFSGAAVGVAVLVLGVLLADAYLYAGFSIGYVLLLAGGLLADPVLGRITGSRGGRSGLRAWSTAAVLTAIPALTTVGLALKTMQDAGGY